MINSKQNAFYEYSGILLIWGYKRVGNDLATKQQQEEARDAAKHLMMHRTTPKNEELSSLKFEQCRRSNLEY